MISQRFSRFDGRSKVDLVKQRERMALEAEAVQRSKDEQQYLAAMRKGVFIDDFGLINEHYNQFFDYKSRHTEAVDSDTLYCYCRNHWLFFYPKKMKVDIIWSGTIETREALNISEACEQSNKHLLELYEL
ncbi:MAG: hypothetical protein V3R25_09255 [Nitrosomonadaceae bacterium]